MPLFIACRSGWWRLDGIGGRERGERKTRTTVVFACEISGGGRSDQHMKRFRARKWCFMIVEISSFFLNLKTKLFENFRNSESRMRAKTKIFPKFVRKTLVLTSSCHIEAYVSRLRFGHILTLFELLTKFVRTTPFSFTWFVANKPHG